MEIKSISRNVRLAPTKIRDLAKKIRGLSVAEALGVTSLNNERKGAFYLGKTLKSAIANAEHNAKLSVDELWIKDAVIDEASRLKRFWPRARGSAGPVFKRMCHIKITLTDESIKGKKK